MTQPINVQQKLFDMQELTEQRIRNIMANRTCRQCANRQTWNNDTARSVQICTARRCGRTASGYARCRTNQPACILFELKQK
ncbi:MAG: hypothetical protein J6U04_06365 [Salinivirgaceae bacterium]|nr:hypothetical protein [Salinivirgaceae bacterium]